MARFLFWSDWPLFRPAAPLIWNYISEVGVGSILGHFAFCRLGWADSRFCWVSLHSTQPTFCRCYCEMRNPTTADFGTEPHKFLFWLNWAFFWPATPLMWNYAKMARFLFRSVGPFFWPAAGLTSDIWNLHFLKTYRQVKPEKGPIWNPQSATRSTQTAININAIDAITKIPFHCRYLLPPEGRGVH